MLRVCLSFFSVLSPWSDKWDSCETASFSSCLLYSLSLLLAHTVCVCAPFRASAVIITRRVAVGSTTSYKRDKARGQTGLATPLPQMIGFGAATTIHVLVHVQRSPYAIMQCSFSLKMVAVEERGGSFFCCFFFKRRGSFSLSYNYFLVNNILSLELSLSLSFPLSPVLYFPPLCHTATTKESSNV